MKLFGDRQSGENREVAFSETSREVVFSTSRKVAFPTAMEVASTTREKLFKDS